MINSQSQLDLERMRGEIRHSLNQSGFKVYGPNESDFYRLVNQSTFINSGDLEQVSKRCKRYSVGSLNREFAFRTMYESTLGGKVIGNVSGFLTGGLGTYILTSGDGTFEKTRNIILSAGVGLLFGKILGAIGKKIGLKNGIKNLENISL